VSRHGSGYIVRAGGQRFAADHVVVAMSGYQRPRLPAFALELDAGIVQMHSSAYRNPSQLRPGGVLIVGLGNSGAELAIELARAGHAVSLAGRETGHIPFRMEQPLVRRFVAPILFRLVFHRVMTLGTRFGRKARPSVVSKGTPLIRVKPVDLTRAGVRQLPRVVGISHGRPELEDGRVLDVENVIWCTGFKTDFSWIRCPVFDEDGKPIHERGVVRDEPGLYFVGLPFLYAMSSAMIHGVGRDARFVVDRIAARLKLTRA
jgi:putative flavoprotein involved in K+ transport